MKRGLLFLNGDCHAEGSGHGFVLPADVINGDNLAIRLRVLPGCQVQTQPAATLVRILVVSFPGDFAARGFFLVLAEPPVSHVLAVDNGNRLDALILIMDLVFSNEGVILSFPDRNDPLGAR